MLEIVDDLKHRARVLQRQAQQNDPCALARLRKHSELSGPVEGSEAPVIKRRHCLATVAKECGFEGWSHLTAVIGGATEGDFGTLLYGSGCSAHYNIWSASYDEARVIRQEHGGFLLPYKRQFLIVDEHYLETLGLDPTDADWQAIGRDWVRPASVEARSRLYAKLITSCVA